MLKQTFKYFSENLKFVSVSKNDLKKFQKVFTEEEKLKYLDPYGFLNENEIKEVKIEKLPEKTTELKLDMTNTKHDNLNDRQEQPITSENNSTITKKVDVKNMPKEYGLKYNGPEPTRYGDWVIKGKCVDF